MDGTSYCLDGWRREGGERGFEERVGMVDVIKAGKERGGSMHYDSDVALRLYPLCSTLRTLRYHCLGLSYKRIIFSLQMCFDMNAPS